MGESLVDEAAADVEGGGELIVGECHAVIAQGQGDDAVPCAPEEERGFFRRVVGRGLARGDGAFEVCLEPAEDLVEAVADLLAQLVGAGGEAGTVAVEGEEAERPAVVQVEPQVHVAGGDDLLEGRVLGTEGLVEVGADPGQRAVGEGEQDAVLAAEVLVERAH